jgi:hypothetical protein
MIVRLTQAAVDCCCLIEQVGCLVPMPINLGNPGQVKESRGAAAGIADDVPDGEGLLAEGGGRPVIPYKDREVGGRVQHVPLGRAGGRSGCR